MILHPLLESLSLGDKRMVKGVDNAVETIINDPALFSVLIDGLSNENKLIAMRSADAIEKLTIDNPEWLQPYKNTLIEIVNNAKQQEVRWHLCQFIPRLSLSIDERKELIVELQHYLNDKSKIVVTFTLQALADLAGNDKKMIQEIKPIIEELTLIGSPAMQSRGKKLLVQLRSH